MRKLILLAAVVLAIPASASADEYCHHTVTIKPGEEQKCVDAPEAQSQPSEIDKCVGEAFWAEEGGEPRQCHVVAPHKLTVKWARHIAVWMMHNYEKPSGGSGSVACGHPRRTRSSIGGSPVVCSTAVTLYPSNCEEAGSCEWASCPHQEAREASEEREERGEVEKGTTERQFGPPPSCDVIVGKRFTWKTRFGWRRAAEPGVAHFHVEVGAIHRTPVRKMVVE